MRALQFKKIGMTFSVIMLSLVMTHASFAAGREVRSKVEIEREAKAQALKAQQMTVNKISQRVSLPETTVSEFVMKETKESTTSENSRALMELVNGSTVEGKRSLTKMEVESADATAVTLNAIIRLKKASPEKEFHLRLSDLVEINKSWSAEQRSNFNSVLSRASEISELALKEGRKVSPDEAFTKALEEAGLLQKYNEGCR